MVIKNIFDFGDVVYLKTDKEQLPRIVCALKILPNDILYELACGITVSAHYEFELSKEANVLMTTTN